MTDEKYLFVSDSMDKKRTARGAYNKRTHAGRGGRVKMPSDYMTKKERYAMTGECKSYRLNDPMTYAEFKKMPKDLQASYILNLREKFNVSDTRIFQMLGISQNTGAHVITRLNIGSGRGRKIKPTKAELEAWTKWCAGIKEPCASTPEENAEPNEIFVAPVEDTAKAEEPVKTGEETSVVARLAIALHPQIGDIRLVGTSREIAETLVTILGDGVAHVRVSWSLGE